MHISYEEITELRHNARQMVRELGLLKDTLGPLGVTLAERHLLLELDSSSYPQIGEIAATLYIDKSSASRLVARAVKKGLVGYIQDSSDKRRRLLQLTKKGKHALTTIESMAHSHVESAINVLSREAAITICKGMALFANGLTKCRFGEHVLSSQDKVRAQMQILGATFSEYRESDHSDLYAIFRDVVEAGGQFPYKTSSQEEFLLRFFGPQSKVYVCRNVENQVVAGFYLRRNPTDESMEIANAAYMIKRSARGKGLGKLLVEISLLIAKDQGYQAMKYNMVYGHNLAAVNIYKNWGFKITKVLSGIDGVHDGYEMVRNL